MNIAKLPPMRVVVVEDSLTQRAHLVRLLEADGDIEVVGQAVGAAEVADLVANLKPDAMTLDLQIPGGGGLVAIEQVMAATPVPILVLSATVADRESQSAIDALAAGAVLAIPKAARWTPEIERALREQVRTLRLVRVSSPPAPAIKIADGRSPILPTAISGIYGRSLIAIAASSGGPAALAEILPKLETLSVPVLVVQHIHSDFVEALLGWMQRVSPLPVELARAGQRARPGVVHLAPSNSHLTWGPAGFMALASDPTTTHCPSADELFASIARHAGAEAVGVVLTGMGNDGTRGLGLLRDKGGFTIAQDKDSSAVFGMPDAAQRAGVIDAVLPLGSIPAVLLELTKARTSA